MSQLLAKALSTASEEEAIACLRMARKRGETVAAVGASTYRGQTAEYWYNKGLSLYYDLKKKEAGLSESEQKTLWSMYKNSAESARQLREEKLALEKRIKHLDKRPTHWVYPLLALQTIIIIILAQVALS